MSRYDLTDFEWRVIAPLLPNKPRGVPRVDDRCMLNGIFWVLRSGAPRRALPERYGVPAEQYLRGRRVVVDGIVRRIPIVNREYGRTKSFNRWAHQVYVQRLGQVVSVE